MDLSRLSAMSMDNASLSAESDSSISEHGDETWVTEHLLTESKAEWGPESKTGMRIKRKYERKYYEWKEVRGDGMIRERKYVWDQWKFQGIVGGWLQHMGVPAWEINSW